MTTAAIWRTITVVRSTAIAVAVLLALLGLDASAAGKGGSGTVHVKGYYRKDGTYVSPYVRSAPDGNIENNWGTKGNLNPYTGEPGTKPPGGAGIAPASITTVPSSLPPTVKTIPTVPTATETVVPSQVEGLSGPSTAGPSLKQASLEPPTPVSKWRAWQLKTTQPFVSIVEEFRLAGVIGIVCRELGTPPCRPATSRFPSLKAEVFVERTAFVGAVNRVSQRIDIWGYVSLSDCESQRNFIGAVLPDDYEPPTACTLVSMVGPPSSTPIPPATESPRAPTVSQASRDRGRQAEFRPSAHADNPSRVSSFEDDDPIVARLAAQQIKHLRVCRVIQTLGPRIDGLTKDEAAAIIQESIPDFTASDFTQIAVKYGIVRCFEPHTRTTDNCTAGELLRFRRGRCR